MNIAEKHKNLYFAFVALAAINITLTIIGGFINYSAVPWWDMWDGYLNFFIKASSGDWSAWWAQHNEHRILLAHLLFWLDLSYFKGNGIFLIVINYLLVASEFIVLYLCLKERLHHLVVGEKFTRQVLAMLMLAVLFSWIQSSNLVRGFQCQFFLAQLLPLLAFYLLHKSHLSSSRSTTLFIFACLAGVASLGSMANGVLALPLMVLLATILRMNWRRIAPLIILSVLGAYAYFYNYQAPPEHGSLKIALLTAPLDFLQYILLFLGNPFYFVTGKGSTLITEIAGLLLIGSAVFFANESLRSPKTSSLQLVLLTFILYVCLSAVGTAGGRLLFGVRTALTGRYLTPTTVAWLCLLILYAPAIHKKVCDTKSHMLWYLLSIPLLLLPQQFKALHSETEKYANYNLAVLALTLGIKDKPIIQLVYPDTEHALAITNNALAKKLSVFANPPFNNVRQILGHRDTERSDAVCVGELRELMPIADDPHYFQVRGLLESKSSANIPKYIYFLDQQGAIIGFALSGFTNAHSQEPKTLYTKYSGFVGYILANHVGKNIILSGKNPNCELSTLAPVPGNSSPL